MNSEEEATTSRSTFNIDQVGTKQLDEDVSSNSSDESDEEQRENSKTDLSKKVKWDRTDKLSPSSSSGEESENEFSEASDDEKNTSDNSCKENGITHRESGTAPVRPLTPGEKKNLSGKQKVKRTLKSTTGSISVSLSKRRKHIVR